LVVDYTISLLGRFYAVPIWVGIEIKVLLNLSNYLLRFLKESFHTARLHFFFPLARSRGRVDVRVEVDEVVDVDRLVQYWPATDITTNYHWTPWTVPQTVSA